MAKDLADRISDGAVAVLELVPDEPRFAELSRFVLRGGASRFSPVVLDDEPVRYVLPVGVPGKKLDFGTLLIQETRCALVWRTDVTRPYHAMITDLGPKTVVKQSPATVRGDVWGRFDLRHPGMANMTFLVPPVSSPELPRMLHRVLVEEPQSQLGKFETAPLPAEITQERPAQPEPTPVPEPAPEPAPVNPQPHPAPPVAAAAAGAAGASAAAAQRMPAADHAPTQVMQAITDEPTDQGKQPVELRSTAAVEPTASAPGTDADATVVLPKDAVAAPQQPARTPSFEPAQARPHQAPDASAAAPAATATWTPQTAHPKNPQTAPEAAPAASTWTKQEPQPRPQPQTLGEDRQQFAATNVPAVHEAHAPATNQAQKSNPMLRLIGEYGPSFILAFGVTLLIGLGVAKYLGWL